MMRWMAAAALCAVIGLGCVPGGGGGGNGGSGGDDDGGPVETDAMGMGGMGGQGGAGGSAGECMPEGATEQRPCGLADEGVESRTCTDGVWSPWGDCEGAAACAEGDEETEACGVMGNGTRTRPCAGGQWAAWGPCDDPDETCEDGATEDLPCGLNSRGSQSHTCEDGRWGPFDPCEDPDVCVDDASEREACGLNARGGRTRTCLEGQWTDWSACDDPDACTDDTTEEMPCGPNGRGIATRTCAGGQFGEWMCDDSEDCADAAEQSRQCGLNNRGEELRTCADGRWSPWSACVDPDVCTDGEDEARACGLNGRGTERRTCDAGQWGGFDPCDDADECLDGSFELQGCPGGEQSRVCTDGRFSDFTPCLEVDVIGEPGTLISLEGELTAADPLWERPAHTCRLDERPGRWFDAFPITNRTGAAQTVSIRADWVSGDGYLLLYRAPFDPAAPLENCLTGNDDLADSIQVSGLNDIAIAHGEVLVLVATQFGEGVEIGPYTIEVFTDAPGPKASEGTLLITEIMFDPAAVDDRSGEWFEVLNTSAAPVQLAGVAVGDSGGGRSVIEGPYLIDAGGLAVIGLRDDPAVNGGIEIQGRWSRFFLDNAGDTLSLTNYRDALIDLVSYNPGAGWPEARGESIQLDPDAAADGSNDDPGFWCTSTRALPSGDFGTPGQPNPPCAE